MAAGFGLVLVHVGASLRKLDGLIFGDASSSVGAWLRLATALTPIRA